MAYEYKRPEGTLYKVSIAKYNKVFARRGRAFLNTVEVYVGTQRDTATIQIVPSVFGLVSFTILLPLIVVVGTVVGGFPDTWDAIKDVYLCKPRGAFSRNRVYKNSKRGDWQKLMKLIGKEGNDDE